MLKVIDFGAIIKIAFGVCFLFILLSVVAMLQGGMRDNMDVGSLERNITEAGMEQTEEISDWGPTLVTIGISMVLLFLVLGIYLYMKKKDLG